MTNTKKIIEITFVDVIETLGFNEMILSPKPIDVDKPILIDIKVTMPYMGNFIVSFSPGLAQNIVENFFDPSCGMEEELILDTLSEFVNVFVGKVMQQLYPHLAFRIGLPARILKLPDERYVAHPFVDPKGRSAIVYSCLEG